MKPLYKCEKCNAICCEHLGLLQAKAAPPMSEQNPPLAEVLVEKERRIDKARALVSALASGAARWEMQVPARPDKDSDLVLAAALDDAKSLIAAAKEVEALRAARDATCGSVWICEGDESHCSLPTNHDGNHDDGRGARWTDQARNASRYKKESKEIAALRAECERVRKALKEIADFAPSYSEEIEARRMAGLAECAECAGCLDAQRRNWPPSRLCEKHYSVNADALRDQERHINDQRWNGPGKIARAALAEPIPAAKVIEDLRRGAARDKAKVEMRRAREDEALAETAAAAEAEKAGEKCHSTFMIGCATCVHGFLKPATGGEGK